MTEESPCDENVKPGIRFGDKVYSDAVARFCAASAANGVDAMVGTLALNAELVSPISGRMVFRGREDLSVLLAEVYGTVRNLHWHEHVGTGDLQVAVGEAKIGPFTLTDATVFELAEDGLIRRLRPHLRPWPALTLFALELGPRVARHAGLMRRALASRPRAARTVQTKT